MRKNHLFNLMIAIALVIVVALTVREAAATAGMISQTDSAKGANALECVSLPSRESIRTEYNSQRGAWINVSEDGPTGVDGGLIQLLSDYRTCSG